MLAWYNLFTWISPLPNLALALWLVWEVRKLKRKIK